MLGTDTSPVRSSYVFFLAALFVVAFVVMTSIAEPFARAQVGTQDHSTNEWDVIERYWDYNDDYVPLRRGRWDGENGWGYEKIKNKHGWTSTDEYRTEDALESPHRTKVNGSGVAYFRCYYDQRRGVWRTRKVVGEHSNDKGVITSHEYDGYDC